MLNSTTGSTNVVFTIVMSLERFFTRVTVDVIFYLSINKRYESRKTLPSFGVPRFFHNLTGFDGQFILKHMHHINKKDKSDCIGTSSEKLLTYSYHGFKFLDTCHFLKASLATLTDNLKDAGIDKFTHTRPVFGDEFELLLRKGVYPYDYMDCFDQFEETSLPPREAFYNTLTESDIGEEDYEYTLKIWNVFKCETMRDFHTFYMKCDVALICDVFEHFCKIAHADYKLDPKYYITIPSFSFHVSSRLRCKMQYVGETGRSLCERFAQHKFAVTSHLATPIGIHLNSSNHTLNDLSILPIELCNSADVNQM